MKTERSGSSIDQREIRFLIEKNADGIIVIDDDGLVLFANPAAARIFGRCASSLVGSPIGIPFVADDATEIAVHRPAGDQIEVEVRMVETIWDDRPSRLASLRDISQRKAHEEQLRHAAKMEAVGQLTAGIAHDFNNLLTVVLGNLESAQRQSAAADPALLRALENATRGARRAAVLTERLLTFARRRPLEPRLIDANELVSGMSDLLQRTLGETIEVQTALAEQLWPVEIDPAELEAAILNLAVNARDAMPSGGTLTIETATAEFDRAYAAANVGTTSGRYVVISVTDSGAGMPPDVLGKVFEPFFTTKIRGRGTGLGLSQVYGFVKQSGGNVKLYSEVGVGTTARIYLPSRAHSNEDRAPSFDDKIDINVPHSRFGEELLVVEDDEDVRAYTVGTLRELGYTVFEAGDAVSALSILGSHPTIRLLFTDLGLPGRMDGRALAEEAVKFRPSLKILLTTAYSGHALLHARRLSPEIELIGKPFTFAALASRIGALLDDEAHEEKPPRILVVDDEALVRQVIVEVLTGAQCQVEEADSFRAALSKAQSPGEPLAAAIIDLGLPDRRGDALVEEIRLSRPQLPIILATGYADPAIRKRFADDPNLRIITKPFFDEDLMRALQQLGVIVNPTQA